MVANSQERGRERIFVLLDVFPVVQNLEKKKAISVKSSYQLSFAKKKRGVNLLGFIKFIACSYAQG